MSQKRKGGRPLGKGIDDDQPMVMIAEIMATKSSSLYAAAKEVSLRSPWGDRHGASAACQRRWLRKWKADGLGEKMHAAAVEQHRKSTIRSTKPTVLDAVRLAPIDAAWIIEANERAAYLKKQFEQMGEPARRAMAEMARSINDSGLREIQARLAAQSQAIQESLKALQTSIVIPQMKRLW